MPDFSEHTDDDLADVIGDAIREGESRLEGNEGVPARIRFKFRAAHALLDDVREHLSGSETIQPMSGGGPKGP